MGYIRTRVSRTESPFRSSHSPLTTISHPLTPLISYHLIMPRVASALSLSQLGAVRPTRAGRQEAMERAQTGFNNNFNRAGTTTSRRHGSRPYPDRQNVWIRCNTADPDQDKFEDLSFKVCLLSFSF